MERYINPAKIRLTAAISVDEEGDILVSVRDVRRAIAQTPSEDVLAIVRCKDCKNCEEYERCNGYHCTMHDRETFLDDFCSYGERSNYESEHT